MLSFINKGTTRSSDMGRFVIVFRNVLVPDDSSDLILGGGAVVAPVYVAGRSCWARGSITVRHGRQNLRFAHSCIGTVNEYTFTGHSFSVRDKGPTLQFGDKTVNLGSKKATVFVNKDGSIVTEEP